MNSLEHLAKQIAKATHLDADALLDKNDKIFYFLTNNSIIEVERKTHLSRCIQVSEQVYRLVESFLYLIKHSEYYDN